MITSVQQFIICTKAPSPATAPFDSGRSRGIRNQQYLYLFPPIVVAWLLQYSGSRVEHRDGFFFAQMDFNEVQNGEFVLDFKVW